ncbi:MAG: ZIP family metal transporter [Candidatus Dojkabacteria bacterium]|nr:ZIP family metal transporter [Candidatus Dojkabacteria bacterium]
MTFLYILISTTIISLGSLVGIITLSVNKKILQRYLLILISLSAGTMLGGAFFHLIPEAFEELESQKVSILILASFGAFFLVEKILHWHHCHDQPCEKHQFGYLNLLGDGIHNFVDGLIIASAFLTNIELGIITTLAIALHEIPQEISDFGVLLYAGFKRKRALILNFLAASIVILGGIIGIVIGRQVTSITTYFLPIAAGGFIYTAASDLIPELKQETALKRSFTYLLTIFLGVILMYSLKFIEL